MHPSVIGFSRGAYQVRVLAGMVDKVSDDNVFTIYTCAEGLMQLGWSHI
jgi:hypothetical protein